MKDDFIQIGEDKQSVECNVQCGQEKREDTWIEFVSISKLSVRATNVLKSNFASFTEFLDYNESSFNSLRNCGRKTINEIKNFRESIILAGDDQLTTGYSPSPPPLQSEDILRLQPTKESLLLLPIFRFKRLDKFTINDLHPGFKGDTRLVDLVFSVRVSTIWKRLELSTIGEVMLIPARNLLAQKGFGRNCLKEVQDIISSLVLCGNTALASADDQPGKKRQLAVDYSSYEDLVTSFVRHCLKNKRNQEIVSSRLDFPGTMPTLEQLGLKFDLTRERVRQILKRGNALLPIKAHRDLLAEFWEDVVKTISDGGGVINLQDLAECLQKKYDWANEPNPLALAKLLALAEAGNILIVSGKIVTVPSCPCLTCEVSQKFLPSLDFEANDSYHLLVVEDKLVQQCRSQCHSSIRQKLHKAFIEKLVDDSHGKYRCHGDLVFPQERLLIRHGESLENLIVHVLEKHGKPMHFSEIATAIRKASILHKEILDHNVHAAMMRYDTIEIVQRGIYGLKAWGFDRYRSVSTAIENLLDTHDLPMRRSEIIKHLSEEFAEGNISSSLHMWESRFVSIGEGFYDRPEKWRKRSVPGLIELLPDALVDFSRFITSNNNCSYKLVLALVFIRGMDEKGAFYLPELKDRFFNFYLGRHKKGELVEAESVLVHRISELDASEIKNRAIRRPLESFLESGFWNQRNSSLYLHNNLIESFQNPSVHNLMLIVLLKGIDKYFSAIVTPDSKYSKTHAEPEIREEELPFKASATQEEETMNISNESTLSITIKRKNRGKITL